MAVERAASGPWRRRRPPRHRHGLFRSSYSSLSQDNAGQNEARDLILGSSFIPVKRHSEGRRLERLLTLARGPSGKFENLIDVVSDKNILLAAYQRLKAKPGLKIPEIGTAALPFDWFRTARRSLEEAKYDFEDFSKTETVRRYGLRATQHSLKDRYTLLMVHVWAMRTKRCEILSGRSEFYDRTRPNPSQDFTLDFFLNYRLETKFKPRARRPWPPVGDLVIQEAMRMALEQIYEPLLSTCAHGYRPRRGCHTMFQEVQSWLGVTWLLEFDLGDFFNKLDKSVLASTLGEQIQDPKFVELVLKLCNVKAKVTQDERLSPRMERKLKRTGEKKEYEENAVKDSVLAPLLCHIYLQKLDAEVLKIQEEQEKLPPGRRRRSIFRLKPKDEPKQLPVMVRYSRYLDEFVIGVAGSVYLVEKVQDLVVKFLKGSLRLEPDYASFVDISFGSTLFLGMKITAAKSTYDPVIEAKKMEKRKRCKFRFMKLAELRIRCWEDRIMKLTARAWMKGLKKTKGRLQSLETARELLNQKAERAAEDFAIAKLERGESRVEVEELLNCENAVFYNLAAIGIPQELYRAHVHLTELLQRHLRYISKEDRREQEEEDEKRPREIPKIKLMQKEMVTKFGVFPIRLFAPLEMISADLDAKGMIRAANRARRVSSLINAPDESIISYFAAIAYGLLSYYRCADNYLKVKRLVDYQVRWGAILTLACRHDYSPRKTIVEFKRGPQMVSSQGDVIASLPSTPIISRMGTRFYEDIQEVALKDVMKYVNRPM